jgi:hypothetical protein
MKENHRRFPYSMRRTRYVLELRYLRTHEKSIDWLLERLREAKPVAWRMAGPQASVRVRVRLERKELEQLRNAASWEGILSMTLTRQ